METRAQPELDISLILPAYNEAATIVNTIRESHRYFESRGIRSQIIVSADGNDGTREKSRELAGEIPGLIVLGSTQRSGKGRGIRLGVEKAGGQIIGFADADNKVPINEFDKFLPLLREGADLVIGSRAIDSSKIEKAQPLYRQIGSRGFYFFVQTVVGLPGVTDSQCGFKFFRHELAKTVFARQTIDGYMYDVEILAMALRMGARLEQVPVRWRDDADSRLDLVAGNIQNVKDIFRIRKSLSAIRPDEYALVRQAVTNEK
ncbi:MAG TPA: dolichyl-phosphate beta-glucosyltransferase [Bryobacteraceae bacterium]|nr:dolichyl-phosphate beta-glucosyltransferase [Bryobacteraceae bacterium]